MAATASPQVPLKAKPSPLRALFKGDGIAHLVTFLFALSVIAVTALLIWEVWKACAPSRAAFGFGFLTGTDWDPVAQNFGALPFIYGTLVTSVLALIIAVPLGVGAAIFLAELAPPRIANACTFLVELLAAVPSVIYGLLSIFTLIPLMREYIGPSLRATLGFLPQFRGPIFGFGYLTAALVLAIMTFPYIISISRVALMEVPRDQREAALALGATRWESTIQVVVPFARLGIIGSIFLALARALGETMAVTMVIGNNAAIRPSFFAPGSTIAAVIANEFAEAVGKLHISSLIELGLVLFLITIAINGLAELLVIATTRKGSRREA